MRLKLWLFTLLLTACGGSVRTPTAPSDPGSTPPPRTWRAIAGTYTGYYGADLQNALGSETMTLVFTATLPNADTAGRFTGTYALQDGATGPITAHGTLAGQLQDDSTFAITAFGDTTAPVEQDYAFLHEITAWCDPSALATSTPLAGIVTEGRLRFTGVLTIPCTLGQDTYPGHLTVAATADTPH